jgi:PTS system galactitol-specific IIB component
MTQTIQKNKITKRIMTQMFQKKGGAQMARKIKAMVACGSGIATSTVAANAIHEIFNDLSIDVEIVKGTVPEISGRADEMDIVFVTNCYRESISCPVVNVTAFLTGIKKDKKIAEIKEIITKLNHDING